MTTTHTQMSSVREATLYVAFELSAKEWKLGLAPGSGVRPWVRTVRAGDWAAVARAVREARHRFRLPATAPVESCYEAGRDGFWIHWALTRQGVRNRVVDSSSIEVNRRARQAKTDRLDAQRLVGMLMRVCGGESGVWQEVRVPTPEEEAGRQPSRERTALVADRTRLVNQVRSWLTLHGTPLPRARTGAWWERVRDWAGAPLPAALQQRIARAWARWALLDDQLRTLTRAQAAAAAAAPAESGLGRLVRLKGVAATGASVLIEEGLVWREFKNRRQVGGLLGFVPVPYRSGTEDRDQGVSRAGHTRWRGLSLQLAWKWVQWQPTSALTRWFQARFADRGARARRIGIVAVARKLLIALWRYATTGQVPEGAVLKEA